MNPLAIKYGLMALAFIGWTTGVYFFATSHEARIWKTQIAEQKAEAGKVLSDALGRVREKENADADTARQIDQDHAAELKSIADSRDDFANRLRTARRGSSCGNTSGTKAADPSISENPANGSDDRYGSADPGNRLRDAALSLQVYAKACHSWALSVGR